MQLHFVVRDQDILQKAIHCFFVSPVIVAECGMPVARVFNRGRPLLWYLGRSAVLGGSRN